MKSLAIDIDDVLADSMSRILFLYNNEFGTSIKKSDLDGKTIYDILPPEHIPVIKRYQNEKGFFTEVDLIEDSKEVVNKLSEKYNIYIVSSALEFPNSLPDRFNFIMRHFPFVSWRNIIFCGDKRMIKIDMIIDDMIENLSGLNEKGFLFTAYHNLNIYHPNRIDSWSTVSDLI